MRWFLHEMAHVLGDVRYASRSLTRAPALAITVVATIGLGIGTTTAMFALIDAVIIRPLPYPHSSELVRVYTDSPPNRWPFSVADYRALVEQQTSFSAVAGFRPITPTFQHGDEVERVNGKLVTAGYFDLLGIRPFLGSLFASGDGAPGTTPKVLVSQGFWQRHLDGDPDAIGRDLQFDGEAFTLVGVLPRDVGPLDADRDVFMAVEWDVPRRKGPFFITVLARFAPGIEVSAAKEELRAISRRIFPAWQASYQDQRASWGLEAARTLVLGEIGTTLWVSFGAVGLVLLIAVSNAANLLIARAVSRTRELRVRAALGASRRDLVRIVLAESAVLVAGCATLGTLVAAGGVRLFGVLGGGFIPRTQEVVLDVTALCFLIALALSSGLLCSLTMAVHAARFRSATAFRESNRSSTMGVGGRRVRRALVVAEFAVAAPLVVGASLLLGTLLNLQRVEPGFTTDRLLTGAISLPAGQYRDGGAIATFWAELQQRLEALPGVAGVAFADSRPPRQLYMSNNFDLLERPTPAGQTQPTTPWVGTTPGYFSVLGVPVLEGRALERTDSEGFDFVVVDKAWANRFYPNESAVGHQFHSGGSTANVQTVVGVVGTVKHQGLQTPDQGTVYWALPRDATRFSYVFIRTAGEPVSLLNSVRQVVRELGPAVPLTDVSTAGELLAESLTSPRYLALLMTSFAGTATLLTVVGIYGVMAYFVQQRTREIGIRLALGASRQRIARSVIATGMRLALVGVVAGLASAALLTRFMSTLLYRVSATDVQIFLGVSLLMLLLAFAACLVVARRAASVDPATMLRDV